MSKILIVLLFLTAPNYLLASTSCAVVLELDNNFIEEDTEDDRIHKLVNSSNEEFQDENKWFSKEIKEALEPHPSSVVHKESGLLHDLAYHPEEFPEIYDGKGVANQAEESVEAILAALKKMSRENTDEEKFKGDMLHFLLIVPLRIWFNSKYLSDAHENEYIESVFHQIEASIVDYKVKDGQDFKKDILGRLDYVEFIIPDYKLHIEKSKRRWMVKDFK